VSDFKSVDSDWKARAEADRAKLREKLESERERERERDADRELPPASLMTIISTFATQAMIALGEAEIPGAEGRAVDLEAARFAIDSLDVLREKTAGNLEEYEERTLADVLQNLRLRFVKKSKEQPTEGAPGTP
jgi:hypothetical protein